MSKLIVLALLASLACKALFGQWPWQMWALRRRDDRAAEARARALLGVPEGAGREAILAAHRQLVLAVHPDRGGTANLVHEANAARDLLLARVTVASTR